MKKTLQRLCVASVLTAGALPVLAADWPMWGQTASRNMVSAEKGIPNSFDPGEFKQGSEEVDMATTKNVKWAAKLGSQTYGNPAVAGGKVYVGTNNETPRNPAIKGDRGVLMVFDEKTGNLVWQLAAPKLGTGKVSDWEYLGLCSSPAVEGERVYIVTNRCEIMCLDTNGLANGNQGVQDETKYLTDKGQPPHTLGPTDADILWRFDMKEELGVFPHNITNCGPMIVGDKLVVTTSNGVDWTHTSIPNPKAPALCVVDKNTGALLGEENEGVSSRTMHSNWSSPAGGIVNGKEMIIFGGGDGICYGLSTETKDEDGIKVLQKVWEYDCNPPSYRMKDGKPIKYATYEGPSEVIATPVLVNNRVYVPIGQDPEHGEGLGNMVCLDAATGKPLWSYDKIHRSLSTPAVAEGLVYVPDFSGFIHCLDAETGKAYWVYDTKSHIWGSPLVADGKVFVGTEDGDFVILQTGKEMKEIGKVDMRSPVYSSAVVANGTLYVATPTHLYAVAPTTGKQARSVKPARRQAREKVAARRTGLCPIHPVVKAGKAPVRLSRAF